MTPLGIRSGGCFCSLSVPIENGNLIPIADALCCGVKVLRIGALAPLVLGLGRGPCAQTDAQKRHFASGTGLVFGSQSLDQLRPEVGVAQRKCIDSAQAAKRGGGFGALLRT